MSSGSLRKFFFLFFISISILLLAQPVTQLEAADLVWSPNVPVTNINLLPSSPSVFVDNNGNVYAMYTASSAPFYYVKDLYFAYKPKGGDWEDGQKVNDNVQRNNPLYPDMTMDNNGNTYAVWVDDRGGYPNCNIYYSFKPKGGIGNQTRI